jgi:type VI secretion system protein VasG
MTIVPYLALSREALGSIARLKLEALKARLLAHGKVALNYSEALVEALVERCREVDTGARNIDHILAANVLPQLAQTLLEKMTDKEAPPAINLDVDSKGEFSMSFAGQSS